MGYLLKHYSRAVYIAVFGFVLGSLFSVFVNYEIIDVYWDLNALHIILSLLTLIGGTIASYRLNTQHAA
jgi:uncharacterized membrane protein